MYFPRNTYIIVPRIEVEAHLAEPLERAWAIDVRGDQATCHCTLVDELVDLIHRDESI